MNAERLKARICQRLWETVDAHDYVTSATLTGSFAESPTLEGISDIDFVLVVDHLDAGRFEELQAAFDRALRGDLRSAGYDLLINATLGPLKFNRPDLAVLHLMIYSEAAHVDHVINSPFTCLDWQRATAYRKRSLGEVYPVFGLQPRHFMGARRSVQDYLRDFHASRVSYRELVCDQDGYVERKCDKPMTLRDRHEFAYHVCRFLMQNLLKLLTRANAVLSNEELLPAYFGHFPEGADEFGAFFRELARKKKAIDFDEPTPDLDAKLTAFVGAFERQFREAFFEKASRHVAFRHAPTALNRGTGAARHFQGRIDADTLPIEPVSLAALRGAVDSHPPARVFASPLARCRQSLAALGAWPDLLIDDRLAEIDYGRIDGLTVTQARAVCPELFRAWERGEDPRFPDGENTADVQERIESFVAERWTAAGGDSLTCTHNGVLRCLVGSVLGVPHDQWHRLRVPHLGPITFVQSERFGLFVELGAEVERELFADFVPAPRRRAEAA